MLAVHRDEPMLSSFSWGLLRPQGSTGRHKLEYSNADADADGENELHCVHRDCFTRRMRAGQGS